MEKMELYKTVESNDMEKMQLYKTVESKSSLSVAYRARQTRQCDTITVPQSTTFSWRLM